MINKHDEELLNPFGKFLNSIGVLTNKGAMRLLHPVGFLMFMVNVVYIFLMVGISEFKENISGTFTLWKD